MKNKLCVNGTFCWNCPADWLFNLESVVWPEGSHVYREPGLPCRGGGGGAVFVQKTTMWDIDVCQNKFIELGERGTWRVGGEWAGTCCWRGTRRCQRPPGWPGRSPSSTWFGASRARTGGSVVQGDCMRNLVETFEGRNEKNRIEMGRNGTFLFLMMDLLTCWEWGIYLHVKNEGFTYMFWMGDLLTCWELGIYLHVLNEGFTYILRIRDLLTC